MSNCFEVTSKFGNICSFKSDSVNKGDKVYTSPQTKPLTDDEIKEIYYKNQQRVLGELMLNHVKFARAIEERHGIK